MTLLLLLACGSEDPCAGVADPARSPMGLEVTAEEHPGWGRDTCVECHPSWTYHQADCMAEVTLDLAALPNAGAEACVSCHGGNGVWEDSGE